MLMEMDEITSGSPDTIRRQKISKEERNGINIIYKKKYSTLIG